MFLQCMSRAQIKCCISGSETLIPAYLLSFRSLKRDGVGMKKDTGGQSPLGLWVVPFVSQAVIEVGIPGILQGRFVNLWNWVLEAGDSLVLDVLRPYFAEIGAHWGMSVKWWGWTRWSRLDLSQRALWSNRIRRGKWEKVNVIYGVPVLCLECYTGNLI